MRIVERRAWVFEERSGFVWLLLRMQRNTGGMLILGEWAFVKGDRVVIVWNRRGGGYATALVA
jgi:hypothetical protein